MINFGNKNTVNAFQPNEFTIISYPQALQF